MEFGKLSDLSGVDFSLPVGRIGGGEGWPKGSNEPVCEVLMGCPAWGCKDWVGKLYPLQAKPADYLQHYARQFRTIELNTTYYRTPDAATVARWNAQTPPDFRFAPKISQQISHDRRLGTVRQLTEQFCEAFVPLGEKLGCFFLQLPSNFSPAEGGKLIEFIEYFPQGFQVAVEFRHEAWFSGGSAFQEALDALAARGFPTVLTDVAGRRDVLHMCLTAPEAMIRFVGNALHPTDFQRAEAWADRLAEWAKAGLKRVYLFIHEPNEVDCPDMSIYFAKALKQRGLSPKLPQLVVLPKQGTLF